MPIAKVTSKGQITIPVSVRKKLGLGAGSRVSFSPYGETYILSPQYVDPLDELYGFFKNTSQVHSIEEMNEAISEKAKDLFVRS
jgi:AbrB family looped-hinge helix DNA binding protein